jgi:hypothetical protein
MIIITKINNSFEINKKLLELIDKIPNNPFIDNTGNVISHTDWNLPQNFKREYIDYFLKIIEPYLEKICSKLNTNKFVFSNFWFQQYIKNDKHEWHTHPKTNFTNVYFVELPDKSLATEILNEKNLEINEGDLLTFPAFYYHRSPINMFDKRKTIISFNADIYDYQK